MPSDDQKQLEGAALDAAVAAAEGLAATVLRVDEDGWHCVLDEWTEGVTLTVAEDNGDDPAQWVYSPSTDWAIGGPIIERERIAVIRMFRYVGDQGDVEHGFGAWRLADGRNDDGAGPYFDVAARDAEGWGPTPLIAAMRALVSARGIPTPGD